jgi:UDP-GlcNAc:undecaprenyl-phosphate GlcNAc-1-phosphate transferase
MIAWAALAGIALSFGLSVLATPLARRVALRMGIVDTPGQHKTHARPVPLLGGCAIFASVLGPSLLVLALTRIWAATEVPRWLEGLTEHVAGAAERTPTAIGILAGAFALHVIGLIDDRRGLGPWLKLLAQVVICAGVVAAFGRVRVLTVIGEPGSAVVTVAWLVAITNAFNFLDNMDGLSAGVAAICAAGLLAASATVGQLFVPAMLCPLLGALLGFLVSNFPPAKIYMGDAGSLVVGYLLGAASCLTTYVQPGRPYYLYGIFVPLVLMALPLYDMVSVIVLRLRDRASPVVGDRRHFSHRLLQRGMSVRTVLLTVYLCTGTTASAALLLSHVRTTTGAILVFAQTVAILLIVALLESSGQKR